jgi:hypothetical protein
MVDILFLDELKGTFILMSYLFLNSLQLIPIFLKNFKIAIYVDDPFSSGSISAELLTNDAILKS